MFYRCYAGRFLAGNFGYEFGVVKSVLGFRSQLRSLTKADLAFERPRGLIAGPLELQLAFTLVFRRELVRCVKSFAQLGGVEEQQVHPELCCVGS